MRDAALLGARLLLGGYMGMVASQKLLGKFHGSGIETMSNVFEKGGLVPGREHVIAASATEIIGGALTITGIADPAGPLAVAGAMSVAAVFMREGGLMAARGGIELPVAYVTLALTLAATGPGKYRLGPSLPEGLVAVGALVGGAAAGAVIAKMVMNKEAPAEVVAEAPAADG
jgi:putative oxidoreductase